MTRKKLIKLLIAILIIVAIGTLWFISRNQGDNLNTQTITQFQVNCNGRYETQEIKVTGIKCPEDSNSDGFADSSFYILQIENKSDEMRYVKFNDRSRNGDPGDKEYLILQPNSQVELNIDYVVRSLDIDDAINYSRTFSVLKEIEFSSIQKRISTRLTCPQP